VREFAKSEVLHKFHPDGELDMGFVALHMGQKGVEDKLSGSIGFCLGEGGPKWGQVIISQEATPALEIGFFNAGDGDQLL